MFVHDIINITYCHNYFIASLSVKFIHRDTRSNEVLKTYQDSHNDDVTHVSFHQCL